MLIDPVQMRSTSQSLAQSHVHSCAGIDWACKMLDTAEVLSLSGDSSQKVADAVAQGSQSITELQQLCIETSSIHDPGCLPWLLSKATRVRVLVATVYARQWLPSLESLTHLVLELPGREAGNVCSALSKAKALQTLCLSNSLAQHQERRATPVNLDMPPSLKVLALKGICPDKLSIPKSCCLHLGRIPNLDLKQAKWASSLSKVRSLHLQIGKSSSIGAISKDCVIPATNVWAVILQMGSHSGGLGNKKMLQCVANVPHSSIHGQNVMFHLPSDAAW